MRKINVLNERHLAEEMALKLHRLYNKRNCTTKDSLKYALLAPRLSGKLVNQRLRLEAEKIIQRFQNVTGKDWDSLPRIVKFCRGYALRNRIRENKLVPESEKALMEATSWREARTVWAFRQNLFEIESVLDRIAELQEAREQKELKGQKP
ncbi:hypothetical protein HZB89_00580 [archaeon]|nr:hypothetical protein [archaeon]